MSDLISKKCIFADFENVQKTCLACKDRPLSFDGKCLWSCPIGYWNSKAQICIPCNDGNC